MKNTLNTAPSCKQSHNIILGIDVGTTGIRGCIVKRAINNTLDEQVIYEHSVTMPEARSSHAQSRIHKLSQSSDTWINCLNELLEILSKNSDLSAVTHIICDATSSTVLLIDSKGKALTEALMYNDSHAVDKAELISEATVNTHINSAAHGASSTLAKVLKLTGKFHKHDDINICHQADFINQFFCGVMNITDENNALKLGYDSVDQAWPKWVVDLLQTHNVKLQLPQVVTPGTFIGKIRLELVKRYKFNPNLTVNAGTTDSIAGFLAAGASKPGEAVSSLGSTIAIKAISDKPIFNSQYGLYSHKLNNDWLIGGASNAGGLVLLNYYTFEQLERLINYIEFNQLSLTDKEFKVDDQLMDEPTKNWLPQYYPLLKDGERFPIADTQLKPQLPEQPKTPAQTIFESKENLDQHAKFLFKLLQGLAAIEKLGYLRLEQLGAPKIQTVYTVGGGTKNCAWMSLREQLLTANIKQATNSQAAFGVTRLIH